MNTSLSSLGTVIQHEVDSSITKSSEDLVLKKLASPDRET